MPEGGKSKLAASKRKSTRSHTASKAKKTRAPRGFRVTSVKVNKTKAREYREAKNPDFKVRIVRHGRKPAEYFVDVQHRPNETVKLEHVKDRWGTYIAKTSKLKNGEIREITLPYNGAKIEKFIREAERTPDIINELKEPNDLFGFTVEGHKVQTTFANIRSLQKLVEYYRNTGSNGAKISIFRIKKQSDWQDKTPLTIAAIKRRRVIQQPRRQFTAPFNEARNFAPNRKRRYYEKIKTTADYKAKHRERNRLYRQRKKERLLRARHSRRKNR